METRKPQRYFLLTYPRTASNLLIKILNLDDQPSIQSSERGGYFLMPQLKTLIELFGSNSRRHLREWTLEEKVKVKESQQGCFEAIRKHAEEAAREGKGVFVKEHVPWLMRPSVEREFLFGDGEDECGFSWGVDAFPEQMTSKLNETIFPDEFLKTWKPTFLIRHPVLAFPSDYRTSVDLNGAEFARDRKGWELDMTLKWSRTLYDWYLLNTSSNDSFPIIIDADDIMLHPELVVKYAQLIGLDAQKLRFKWDVVSREEQEGMWAPEKRMRDSIDNSEGLMKGKSSTGLVIEEEVGRWKGEFGEMEGGRLEEWVRRAMVDYEYLRERRLRL